MAFAMLLGGGGGFDALDLLPAEQYWQVKNVAVNVDGMLRQLPSSDAETPDVSRQIENLGSAIPKVRDAAGEEIAAHGSAVIPQLRDASDSSDPEVAARARELIHRLESNRQAGAIRRLMAIRTLGELEDERALEVLRRLQPSRKPFESEYAERAVARIEGRPWRRAAQRGESDVWRLPESCGLVAEARLFDQPGADVGSLHDAVRKAMPMLQAMGGGAEDPMRMIATKLIEVFEKTGNLRVDSVVAGMTEDIDEGSGKLVVIFRGVYNAPAFSQWLQDEGTAADDGGRILRPDEEVGIAMPSDRHLAILITPGRDNLDESRAMLAGLKRREKPLERNAKMTALVRKVAPASFVWARGTIPRSIRDEPAFGNTFSDIAFDATQEDGVVSMSLEAEGPDADQVRAFSAQLDAQLQTAKTQLQQMAQMGPMAGMFQPVTELLESIRIGSKQKTMKVTGSFKPDLMSLAAPWIGIAPMMQAID
ncbi:MAG: hypothetical protein CMJ18_06475 [Phycisphaeraceae bacterium]|nr:hypothetical protein [Phycisphaeraceae bacterium]